MSSVRKEHIKSLKAPDQFQVKVMTVMEWGVKNIRLLSFVLVPVAVVIAGLFAYRYVQTKRKDARLEELGKVQVVYDAEAKTAADLQKPIFKKLQDLEEKAGPKEAGKAPATPAPQFEAEKEALRAQAEAIKPNHTASAAEFLIFYKKYDTYPEGWLAGMMAARSLVDENKLADAAGLLEGINTKAKNVMFYRTVSGLTLEGVLEEQGNYDKALVVLADMEKTADNDLKPKLLLARGRALVLKGNNPDAKTALNTLVDTYGTSAEAQKARSLLALLSN